MRLVCVGHVDHGKSTLVGRLLEETHSVLPAKMKQVEEICRNRGKRFEYAFLLDALKEEQDQGITIDASQALFRSSGRVYRMIDTPGHKEFLKHMISGASGADAALLLIDAEEGLRDQSKRHAGILSFLGVRTLIVVVNKMDKVGFRQDDFLRIAGECMDHLASLTLIPKAFIPISAYSGDNVKSKSPRMPWYEGPALLPLLDSLEAPFVPEEGPLRLPIQDVYKFDARRILAGRIESGCLSIGDKVVLLPSEKTSVIKTIEQWNAPARERAIAGECVGITLADSHFIERGEVLCHPQARPQVACEIRAHIFWMRDVPLQKGAPVTIRLATQEMSCAVESILKIVDSETALELDPARQRVGKNEAAEVVLKTPRPCVFDAFHRIAGTGRFVMIQNRQVYGGGTIL